MTSPETAFLVAVGVVGFVLALLAVGAAVSPRARRQLRFLARQSGIGPGTGLALVAVFAASFGSVFALGGTTSGRYDYPFLLATLGHLVGLFLLGVGVVTVPEYLFVRRAPRRDAAEVVAGADEGAVVAVEGEVAAREAVETPFAGERAVCYETRVMERRGESDAAVTVESLGVGGNWVPEYVDEVGTPFDVEDGTGRLRVDPRGADRRLDERTEVSVGTDDDLPDRVREFLRANLAEVGYGAHDRRYVEAALAPGDRVAVVGPTVAAPDARDGPGAHVAGDAGRCLVAAGGLDGLRASLGRRVRDAGGGGLLVAAGSYLGMLATAGVL